MLYCCDPQRWVIKESTGTKDRLEAEQFLRERPDARDDGTLSTILSSKNRTFNEGADWFVEKRSKPPFRSENTHAQSLNALKHLRPACGNILLADLAGEAIDDDLPSRLDSQRCITTKLGIRELGKLKPATVHQEFRVLTRILNPAVQEKRLATNPCTAVEFPVSVSQSTRKPHYMTASEQAGIEFWAPSHLKNAVVILVETGLRPYRELLPMRKSQFDLQNSLVHISDSKTPNGIGDMPLTDLASRAFKAQIDSNSGSDYLFPALRTPSAKPHLTSLRKIWTATLKRAGAPYFPLYHLRLLDSAPAASPTIS